MEDFIRPVQWILSSTTTSVIVLISPVEANALLPTVRDSRKAFLHLYAPRVSRNVVSVEDMEFFTIPRPRTTPIPESSVHELNLFSGQLFFQNKESFKHVCEMLGLHLDPIPEEFTGCVDVGGFIADPAIRAQLGMAPTILDRSPVAFLRELVAYRRKGQGYTLTHVGKMLYGNDLDDEEFAT